jgi:hypothetical protein
VTHLAFSWGILKPFIIGIIHLSNDIHDIRSLSAVIHIDVYGLPAIFPRKKQRLIKQKASNMGTKTKHNCVWSSYPKRRLSVKGVRRRIAKEYTISKWALDSSVIHKYDKDCNIPFRTTLCRRQRLYRRNEVMALITMETRSSCTDRGAEACRLYVLYHLVSWRIDQMEWQWKVRVERWRSY